MRRPSMKRSTKRLRCERATRCRITSVSVVDCIMAPSRTSWRRSVRAVGEIAVMADGEAAGVELGEQRLHVAQDGLAGGRIAHMADRGVAGQAVDHLAARKGVADQAETAFGMEALAVEGDDAGGLLAAVLQRVQAERRDRGRVGVAENAEHAAFFAQPVGVKIEEGGFRHRLSSASTRHSFGLDQARHPDSAAAIIARVRDLVGGIGKFAMLPAGGVSGLSVSSGLRLFQLL